MSSSAVFNNLVTGVMDIQVDGGVIQGIGQTLNNVGALVKSAGTGTSTISVSFNNTGTVEVQTGELEFYGGFGLTHSQTAGATILNGGGLAFTLGMPFDMQGGRLYGSGTVTGDVQNTSGSVEPGLSAGMLVVDGNYTQAAGAALKVEIGGLIQGTNFDYLAVSGNATLAGTLEVELINGFVPNAGETFEILTAANVTGVFDTVALTNLPQGLDLRVGYAANSVVLKVVPTLTPGDMNCDGFIDGLDSGPFVLALLFPMQYGLDFSACRIDNGDINADTNIDTADIGPFVTYLLNGDSCP